MSEKIYNSIKERQAAYRQRIAKERSEIQDVHVWVGRVLRLSEELGWVESTHGYGRDQETVLADLKVLYNRLRQELDKGADHVEQDRQQVGKLPNAIAVFGLL